jgi:hypothetical protein
MWDDPREDGRTWYWKRLDRGGMGRNQKGKIRREENILET